MSYELIKVEKKDHLTIVTINRPEVMNAISPPTSVEMDRAFKEVLPGSSNQGGTSES